MVFGLKIPTFSVSSTQEGPPRMWNMQEDIPFQLFVLLLAEV